MPVTVTCNQCQVLVINNIPTHEIGCPNSKEDDDYFDTFMFEDDDLV